VGASTVRIIALDVESFFSADYNLKKLSTEAYLRDERFKLHGAAIKWGSEYAARWYDERQLAHILKTEDWSGTAIISHHAHFDMGALSFHYDVHPKLILDTLSMARLLLGNHHSVSLDSVRRHFALPAKNTPYERFKGKRFGELSEEVQALLVEGCCDEVESIWTIFQKLAAGFPPEEFQIIDMTVRMFTEPKLRANTATLARLWMEEETKKVAALVKLDVSAQALGSNDAFTTLLEAEGVEIAWKEGKNGKIPAFARIDDFMRDLLEDENPRVRALAEARLGVKSSLLQTRAETIGAMATRGNLAIYLRYCGAHTTRWSGGDGSNFQNLKRGSDLRAALLAPEGFLLGILDFSQIECRILNYLAGQDDVIARFRAGEDPYTSLASRIYGRAITKDDPTERGTGKQAELSCGFGCGWRKFQRVAALGTYGPIVKLSDQEAETIVNIYRETHADVVAYWREAEVILARLNSGVKTQWGPVLCDNHRIWLPNGAPLIYDTLRWEQSEEGSGWKLQLRTGWTKLYGAKLVENVVQALARVVMSQAMIRLALMYDIALCSHDEIVVLIPEDGTQEDALAWCKGAMQMEPTWLPGIPIAVEAHLDRCYSK
jgi:DNA polymerase bacteriophage-type